MSAKPEIKVQYEQKIITIPVEISNKLDVSQIPVFQIENCEVLFSSLTAQTPKYGHSVKIMLPADTDLVKQDRTFRNKLLAFNQEENPNLEVVKGVISIISKKDVLEEKFEEKYLNRAVMNFAISSPSTFDRTTTPDGKSEDKFIQKVTEAVGTPVVKYFRAIDRWTGEGIDPQIYKYENGEKVTTYTTKEGEEKPLYISSNDIVTIKIRPYLFKNKKNGELTLKYNLLSIEQVQTAYDRGIKSSGGGKKQDSPDGITNDGLTSIFAGFGNTTVSIKKEPEIAKETQTIEKTVNTKTETTEEVEEVDFSALGNIDFSSLGDLGE